jgi:hypothetical protein
MPDPNEHSLGGAVVFADPTPPPPETFGRLPGFSAERAQSGSWKVVFEFDGVPATLEPMARFVPLGAVVAHDPRLTEHDRVVVQAGRSAVRVTSAAAASDPFSSRKRLLALLGTLMGKHGVAAVDPVAQAVWTRERLDDELAHDAPLDIEQMYTLHAVTDDQGVAWLHSHGLAELGGFDLDVVRPHRKHAGDAAGIVRALAFASVEGKLRPGGPPVRPSALEYAVRAVDAEEFMRTAAADDACCRDPADHTERRVVLCEPAGPLLPWLSTPQPARLFQFAPPDTIVFYSTVASRRMAERARATYARFRATTAEFADLRLPALVKLGYPVDGGSDELEYLWFEVHAFHDDAVDATLTNVPDRVSHLRQGQRARHPVAHLTDWTILTPLGSVSPISLHRVRQLRSERPRVERAMREHRSRRG